MILPISSRNTLPAHASVRPRISSWSVLKTWNTNSTWERVWKTSQTLHFVFEHESREWNLEREWSERNLEREWNEWNLECEWNEWNWEREWNEWNLEREWSERSESYVTFVTNVTNETNVTNVTNVKQEMAIGGDATRHSCASLKKIQQFWAIFQRFDINIFNFREHFPPPNFAYSARSFSWMRT